MGAGVLAYAVPATATGTDRGSGGRCTAEVEADNLQWSFEGQTSTPTGKAWIKLRDGHHLCNQAHDHIVLSIYKVPDTWDGAPFPGGDNSAVPQHVIAHDAGTLDGHKKLYLQVPVPDCGNAQIDLYFAPKQNDVDTNGTARFIAGFLFSMANGQSAPHGQPGNCTPPTTPPPTTTPPPPTTTVPPTTTPPPTTTTPPPPPTTTTTPPPTTTVPPTTTEAPPITTVVPPTTTAPPIAAPIPVLPHQPTRLAETGSNSTIPLLGLGSLLLASGIGLSLVGRRRRPTPA
jgi:LPXTG-motif cell wall-anchored protein